MIMAKKEILKNRQGEVVYPITTTDCIYTENGKRLKEEYATKQYANEAAADILNSSPEQLEVINTLGEKLADDNDLANAVTKTVADAKKQLFIDLWNKACEGYGKYNTETGFFELNGLTDITFDQAIEIYNKTGYIGQNKIGYGYKINNCRTNLPEPNKLFDVNIAAVYRNFGGEVLNITGTYSNRHINLNQSFQDCNYLKKIQPTLQVMNTSGNDNNSFQGCLELEEVRLYDVKINISFSNCSKLSYDSLKFLVDNAKGASQITITLHPNVFAKLTEGDEEWQALNELALSKQITFATA